MVMEFKGTKGKWHLEKYSATILDEKGKSIVCWYGVATSTFEQDEIKLKANSQLISKAPEMLEMLKNILVAVENSNIEADVISIEELEQLIKEATTI